MHSERDAHQWQYSHNTPSHLVAITQVESTGLDTKCQLQYDSPDSLSNSNIARLLDIDLQIDEWTRATVHQ